MEKLLLHPNINPETGKFDYGVSDESKKRIDKLTNDANFRSDRLAWTNERDKQIIKSVKYVLNNKIYSGTVETFEELIEIISRRVLEDLGYLLPKDVNNLVMKAADKDEYDFDEIKETVRRLIVGQGEGSVALHEKIGELTNKRLLKSVK